MKQITPMSDSDIINRHKIIIKNIANILINENSISKDVDYVFNDNNKVIFNNLLWYFSGNGIDGGYDIDKGIAIIGTYGTGKTTIFRIFQRYCHLFDNGNAFRITSLNEIIENLQDERTEDILTYNIKSSPRGAKIRNPLNICINEFGAIDDIKIYGSSAKSLFQNFMMKRYEIFQEFGKKTHITTNITGEQMRDLFSAQLIDRFKEMFNTVKLTGKSFRI